MTSISPTGASSSTGLRRLLPRSLPAQLLLLAGLAYAIGFSYLTITRFYAFEARALDMGNLDQAIWNTAHGRPFHLTNQPGTINRLSLHVEPIILPISLLYWIYSGPPTLLVLQATMVALSAWPLFALARERLRNDWLALLFGLAALLNPTLQAANWLEFHPLTLAPTFLLAAFYFLIRGRTGWFATFAILAASCKEEIALLIFMMGGYAWLVLRRPRVGLITMALSVSWALFAVLVIQQTFAAGNIHWGRYAYLGETPGQILWSLFTQPAVLWAQLVEAQVGRYLFLLLLPVGFLAVLAPELLLLALPSLALNWLSDYSPMHEVTTLMYAAAIVPFVLIAAVEGARRLRDWGNGGAWLRGDYVAALLLLLGVSYAHSQFSYLPGGGNFRHYTITDHHRRAASIIAQIAPDAKVSAQDRLNPHVSGRETVYIFPRIDDADTILLDVTGPAWPQHPNDLRQSVDQLLAADFGVAAAADGYLLLRRGEPQRELPLAFYQAWQPTQAYAGDPILTFGEQLQLLDVQVITDSHDELVTQLIWRPLRAIDQPLRFYVGYLDAAGNGLHDTQFYPPVAELWYPTTAWQPGQPVLLQTLPWTLDVAQFTLVVAVSTEQDLASAAGRLPITGASDAVVPLQGATMARLGAYEWDGKTWQALAVPSASSNEQTAVQFAEQIRLRAWQWTLPEGTPPAAIDLHFVWQAMQTPRFDYSLFVHLLDEQGTTQAQLDWQPRDYAGPRPMSGWRPDEVLHDAQQLSIPVTLPAGRYQLVLGVYNWQTGERLPLGNEAGAAASTERIRADQTLLLGELQIP